MLNCTIEQSMNQLEIHVYWLLSSKSKKYSFELSNFFMKLKFWTQILKNVLQKYQKKTPACSFWKHKSIQSSEKYS